MLERICSAEPLFRRIFKQLQSVLYSPLITNLVEQNIEGGAVLDGLSAILILDCGFVTTRINKLLTFSGLTDGWTWGGGERNRVDMGETNLRLTGEHGMDCIADQDESVLVPLGNRPSSHQLSELDVSGFSASGV